MWMTHTHLKARQRAERHQHAEGIGLRIHRALSWLLRSELCDDDDGRFIFLWIAFNAAYANDLGQMRVSERLLLGEFLQRLSQLDSHDYLYQLVWSRYPGAIRMLLDNRYVCQPYWDHQNGLSGSEDWEERFSSARQASHAALALLPLPCGPKCCGYSMNPGAETKKSLLTTKSSHAIKG